MPESRDTLASQRVLSSRSATNTTQRLSKYLNRSEINYSKNGGPQNLDSSLKVSHFNAKQFLTRTLDES